MPIRIITGHAIIKTTTTRHSALRWLTALVIVCICSITAAWGWQAARFAYMREASLANPTDNVSLTGWDDVPGLAAEALERSSAQPAAAALPAAARTAQLAALLAAKPMSSQAWLSLAGERLVLGRPASEIDAALRMSRITGPNEGPVMWHRGMFELVRWSSLSADARAQAAADLATALSGDAVDGGDIELVKLILVQRPATVRAEIATSLRSAGFSGRQLATIGLQATHS